MNYQSAAAEIVVSCLKKAYGLHVLQFGNEDEGDFGTWNDWQTVIADALKQGYLAGLATAKDIVEAEHLATLRFHSASCLRDIVVARLQQEIDGA